MTSPVVITGIGHGTIDGVACLREPVRGRAVRSERVTQLAYVAADAALDDAGLVVTDGALRERMGVVFGTAYGCFLTNAAFERRFFEGGPAAASPRLFAATVSNAAAGEVSIAYRLGGPAITLTAGRVAGLVAIGHAVDCLRARQADVLVAGGVDAAGDALARWMHDVGMEDPPCDDGLFLVLETAAHAATRGARALGTIAGWASGFGDADVRSLALADAGVDGHGDASVSTVDTLPAMAAALRQAARSMILVEERCDSGHAASVVVRPAG